MFQRDCCLVRGIGGTDTRASAELSWRREFVDGAGQIWTPFTYLRADGFWVQPDTTGYPERRPRQLHRPEDDDSSAAAMPAIGLEYRFPFVAELGAAGTQIVEPIAQVIARPNETRIGRLPNEDAQSLVFDDTSLFDWDKFSGYDRVEGGVRANVGAQYTVTGADGFYAQRAVRPVLPARRPRTPSATGDLANTGRDSGLEIEPLRLRRAACSSRRTSNLSFITRGRFDQDDFGLRRIEVGATAQLHPDRSRSRLSLTYARYDAQPELGFDHRREGVLAGATWNITPNWFVSGSALLDLDRYLHDRDAFIAEYLAQSRDRRLQAPRSRDA